MHTPLPAAGVAAAGSGVWDEGMNTCTIPSSCIAAAAGDGARAKGQRDKAKQIIKPYTSIRLDDLLDLSRTPGAVCQSIQRRNAPEVDAGKSLVDAERYAASRNPYAA